MSEYKKLKFWFDSELAHLLADRIKPHHPSFNARPFIKDIESKVENQELKQRVETIADGLHKGLPSDYISACNILAKILGPENEKETGMFTEFYWLMPVAFFVEKYGLDNFDESIELIGEITKRNTGEYAIRPYLISSPKKVLKVAKNWSKSANFHLRRLSSEGLRPRLPWAKKITLFSEDPTPVFLILNNLTSDPSAYVRKSVANNMADFLKENFERTMTELEQWSQYNTKETRWIVKHALRNEIKKQNPRALLLLKRFSS